MIKHLIDGLASDSIKLSSALTTAKVFAARSDIENLLTWTKNELNGYPEGSIVPKYRLLPNEIYADVADHLGRKQTGVILDLSEIVKQTQINLYEHPERSSIESIENVVKECNMGFVMVPFPQNIVRTISVTQNGVTLISAHKRVYLNQYLNILTETKQHLLDLLLDIEKKYPDLDNEQTTPNSEQKETIREMVNNIFYNNQISGPIAVGKKVTQSYSQTNITSVQITLNELSSLGVPGEDVQELKSILEDEKAKDKPSLTKKVTGWLGKLAMKISEKSLELELPKIIEKLHHYL